MGMSPCVQELGDLEFTGIFVLCNAKCAVENMIHGICLKKKKHLY